MGLSSSKQAPITLAALDEDRHEALHRRPMCTRDPCNLEQPPPAYEDVVKPEMVEMSRNPLPSSPSKARSSPPKQPPHRLPTLGFDSFEGEVVNVPGPSLSFPPASPPTDPFNDDNEVRASRSPSPLQVTEDENALEILQMYHTVFIVDDSKSMQGSRWQQACDALCVLTEQIMRYAGASGFDVHFFNDAHSGKRGLRHAASVRSLFAGVVPRGATPMGAALERLLLPYLATLERSREGQCRPVNFIVITDGAPTDDPEAVIVAAAKRLDAGHFPLTQVGIQFVQIGDSPAATAFLRELDGGLEARHDIRDMVDTTPYADVPLNAELLTKILLGGINRRVARYGAAALFS